MNSNFKKLISFKIKKTLVYYQKSIRYLVNVRQNEKQFAKWEFKKFIWYKFKNMFVLFYLEYVRVEKIFGSILKLKNAWTWVWLIESQKEKLIILASCIWVKI